MSQDKELEIQLQFLEEASEYLDTIESVLLGLAGNHIDSQQMDAVLRAAHSVKGGAGMMRFQSLSQLAHRLEDSFKVLKTKRNSIEVDESLESLLLAAVDRLRLVLERNRRHQDVDEQWLALEGNPVFDKLRDRLGDPVADDASTMLGAEEGTNVAALLFETEVEGCLNRLETVLADPQAPCLEEELSIMAQELGGLGEMLQLPAFTQLCESIVQHLETTPNRVKEIASAALSELRRSQALVLVGQVSSLPTQLNFLAESGVPTRPILTQPTPNKAELENSIDEVFAAEFDADAKGSSSLASPLRKGFKPQADVHAHGFYDNVEETVADSLSTSVFREVSTDAPTPSFETLAFDDIGSYEAAEFDTDAKSSESLSSPLSTDTPALVHQDDLVLEERVAFPQKSTSLSKEVKKANHEVQSSSDFSWQEAKPDSAGKTRHNTSHNRESQENTVRIPVRQLDRLNDLFGELTITRNGLSLQLERLRNLIETLERRVSSLEQSNIRLRTAYDTVAISSSAVPAVEKPLVVSHAHFFRGNAQPRSYSTDAPAGRLYSALPRSLPVSTSISPMNSDDAVSLSSTLNINSRFDTLEMDRYSDLHLLSHEVMETIVQIQEVTSDIGLTLEDTDSTSRELNQTAKQLQTHLTRARMRPLSDLVGRFSRALRDMSLQYGKQVELKVYGQGTLIDRSILEALADPLMHLVRNAFDHGIEAPATRQAQGKPPKGVIEIKAAHRGNQTIITVSDDGNGINLNKIRARAEAMGLDAGLLAAASEGELLSLIFEPGFSTADRVTDLSGRGVGMDVVRNNLKQIRGDIRVDTRAGRGTTFTLTVPFTLSVARVLLVESNGMLLAFPTDVIEEMLLLRAEDVLTTPGSEVLKCVGEMVPLTRLTRWLTFSSLRRVTTPEGVPSISEPTVLMISQGDQLHGLVVDRCWGEREVAIRQVEGTLAMPPGFASCTILGDGKVVPLVDAASLLRWIASRREITGGSTPHDSKALLVETLSPGVSTEYHTPMTLGFKPQASDISCNHPETPYKGVVRASLGFKPEASEALPRPYESPLHSEVAGKPLEQESAVQTLSPGVSTRAMCDPPQNSMLRRDVPPERLYKDTILVVDDSINVRRFLALALEKAGYLVEQAKDGQDAVEKLQGLLRVDAVICDIEMPRLDGFGFLARIKSDPKFSELPIAMLTSRSGDKHRQLAMTLGATAYFSKPYNERELLQTLRQVITSSQRCLPA